MADIFCNDGGDGTAPHETWAKAATTFLVAVDAASAGDRIIIGHDHAEDPGGSVTYTFPGTGASPNIVISATSAASGTTITYNIADNIQIDNSTTAVDILIGGTAYFYGVDLKCGDDFITTILNTRLYFEDCTIRLDGSASVWSMGNASGQQVIDCLNTNLALTNASATSGLDLNMVLLKWRGGTISHAGTQPIALFNSGDRTAFINMAGVDLSAITTALVDVSDVADYVVEFHHCLLNSGVALTVGTIVSQGTIVLMSGCDDSTGNDLHRLEHVDYWGSTVHDDDIFRTTGGASDGATPISWKMVSTANAAEFTEPTKSPRIYAWVDSTGSTTFTVQCLWDSVTNIQDDEVWLEIEFLEASADTDSAFADDRMTDITSTPADQTTNATAWTETLTNDNEFALAVTVTVNRVGPVIARVCLAKPSTTIYVDPKIEIA